MDNKESKMAENNGKNALSPQYIAKNHYWNLNYLNRTHGLQLSASLSGDAAIASENHRKFLFLKLLQLQNKPILFVS